MTQFIGTPICYFKETNIHYGSMMPLSKKVLIMGLFLILSLFFLVPAYAIVGDNETTRLKPGKYALDPEAIKLVQSYSKKSHVDESQVFYQLGQSYLNGKATLDIDLSITEANPDLAAKYFIKAAELGSDEGAVFLGSIGLGYYTGDGHPKDQYKGIQLIKKAADLGHAFSSYLYGLILLEKDDIKNALNYLELGSENLSSSQMYGLGVYYWNQGVKGRAFYWFKEAAIALEFSALYVLSIAYLNGDGVPKNFFEAYIWSNLGIIDEYDDASERKLEKLKNINKGLESRLTSEDVMKAQTITNRIYNNLSILDDLFQSRLKQLYNSKDDDYSRANSLSKRYLKELSIIREAVHYDIRKLSE